MNLTPNEQELVMNKFLEKVVNELNMLIRMDNASQNYNRPYITIGQARPYRDVLWYYIMQTDMFVLNFRDKEIMILLLLGYTEKEVASRYKLTAARVGAIKHDIIFSGQRYLDARMKVPDLHIFLMIELPISTKTRNVLARGGVGYEMPVEYFCRHYVVENLLQFRDFGKSCLDDLQRNLRPYASKGLILRSLKC